MSIQSRERAKQKSASQAKQLLVFILFALGMAFALPTMLVLTLGLLPTLVALVVDLEPRKYAARCVGALNLAGIMPFLMALWAGNHDLMAAMKILTDVYAWLVIYLAAGLGWITYLALPSVAGLIMQLSAARRIHRLESRQKKLAHDWGQGVVRRKGPV
jgi:hypothetical protein